MPSAKTRSAKRSARSTRRAHSASSARFSRKKASMSNSATRRIMNSFRPAQESARRATRREINNFVNRYYNDYAKQVKELHEWQKTEKGEPPSFHFPIPPPPGPPRKNNFRLMKPFFHLAQKATAPAPLEPGPLMAWRRLTRSERRRGEGEEYPFPSYEGQAPIDNPSRYSYAPSYERLKLVEVPRTNKKAATID